MAVSYRTAKKRNYPVSQNRVPIGKAFREAVWALLVPLIILGGIYGGIFTPTEAAVVASVYALIIGKFIYKELDFRTTYDAFKDAVLVNGATTFMIGLSMSFAAFLAMEQVPAKIGAWMLSLSSSPAMILLIINILLLIVGCFVDNISSMIILPPILLPIVTKIGVDPVHFGLVMTVALATGFVAIWSQPLCRVRGIRSKHGTAFKGDNSYDRGDGIMPPSLHILSVHKHVLGTGAEIA